MSTDHAEIDPREMTYSGPSWPIAASRWRDPDDALLGDYVVARTRRALQHWKDPAGQLCKVPSGRVYGPLPRDSSTLESFTMADLLETIRQDLQCRAGWPICYDDKAGVAIRELLRRLSVETEDE